MISVLLASKNENKLREFRKIIEGLPVDLQSLLGREDVPDVVEDGKTFEANAAKKACEIARWSGTLSIADDSGLCVDALNGEPGIFSARFAGPAQDDRANCEKLLHMMKSVPDGKRQAKFVCAIAIAAPSGELLKVCLGECEGWIASEMKGNEGFGYDPLFVDPATGRHFAQLKPEEKNRISHRAMALTAAKDFLENQFPQ